MTNLSKIFGCKENVKFKDKYSGAIFTVAELNEAFLKPTLHLPNPIKEMEDLEKWAERFEKVE